MLRRPAHLLHVVQHLLAFALSISLLLAAVVPAFGQASQSIEIAAALSLTGDGVSFGQPTLEGIQLALEEANAIADGPRIVLKTYDDKSKDDEAAKIATQIAASPAQLVIGPSFSTSSLAAGPAYAAANLVSLPATTTSDLITQNETTFRIVFKNSDQGETLANYMVRVLGQHRAVALQLQRRFLYLAAFG